MMQRAGALALASSLFLTACGGGGDDVSPEAALQTPPEVSSQPDPDRIAEPVPTRSTLGTRAALSKAVPILDEGGLEWQSYDRAEDYQHTVTLDNQLIEMTDGVKLFAKITVPATDAGTPAPGPFPVILTQTSYNSSLGQYVPAIGASEYLVKRGYASVLVDVRGTGNSEGTWEAFGEREQADYNEVVNWVVDQEWSDGRIGVQGVSYLGITSILTAQQQNPAVKAAFPIVPIGDGYRDIVFTGGNVNATFIPIWMGAVTGLGILPLELLATDAETFLSAISNHLAGALLDFQVPTMLKALLGEEETVFDEGFWSVRSPLEGADKIQVPTFIVGGSHDLFQRSEPLWFERLKGQVPVKLLIGPWTHIEAAGIPSNGLPADGVPDFDHLQLQWFDEYVMGLDTGVEAQPNVTQYVTGVDRYETTTDWPHPQMSAQQVFLVPGGMLPNQGQLQDSVPENATTMSTLQQPLNGLCSFSTTQWTAGATSFIPLPCFESNDIAELASLKFDLPVGDDGLYINGPLQADLWVSTTAQDVQLSVRVDVVAPSGLSKPLTNGLMTASMQSLDESRSRFENGIMLQPWHTFRSEDRELLVPLEPKKVSVEIFSTSAYIPPGSSLRVSVSTSNVPQGIPPLLQLINSLLGVMTLHMGPEMPSSIALPIVPSQVLQ